MTTRRRLLMSEGRSILDFRLDVVVFLLVLLVGLISYFVLKLTGQPQVATSAVLVSLMVVYALISAAVPRLRVRLDQAADNAYYLGLLFTLVSMAVALWDFGNAVNDTGTDTSGARTIIANFGIALASTIAGIAIRIILYQMRVDPAEVESMSRIELADAASALRAKLDSITIELAQFHDELRQRSGDVFMGIATELRQRLEVLVSEVAAAAQNVMRESAAAGAAISEGGLKASGSLREAVAESEGAIRRLAAIEVPPTRIASRLEKAADALVLLEAQLGRIGPSIEDAATASHQHARRVEELQLQLLAQIQRAEEEAATAAERRAGRVEEEHLQILQRVQRSAEALEAALRTAGETLAVDRDLLSQLQRQAEVSANSAAESQAAAKQVLNSLTAGVEALTQLVESKNGART